MKMLVLQVVAALMVAMLLAGCAGGELAGGETEMAEEIKIPDIDIMVSEKIETATFALG